MKAVKKVKVAAVKNLPAMQEPQEMWVRSKGGSPGGGHGNPLQYSCLENPMDRGAQWATIHEVTESDRIEALSRHACTVYI